MLEAIQDFINENGYYPTIKEMDADPMLPAHASAYIAMGMGYMKVKETYFPDVVKKEEYLSVSRDEWMGKFKVLYKKSGFGEAVRRDNNHHCELIVSISESDLSTEAYDRMEETLKKVLV